MTGKLQQNCNRQSRIRTCLAGFEQMLKLDTLIRRVGGSLIFERARLSFNLTPPKRSIRVEMGRID